MNQFARPGLAVTELPSFNENDNGKILKINGESGKLGWEQQDGLLPQVTSADNGKVLAVENGAWAASEQGKKFIVTLTPTVETGMEGVTDKTGAEIYQAYEEGKEIVFSLPFLETFAYISFITYGSSYVQPHAVAVFSTDGTNYMLCDVYTGQAWSDYTHTIAYTVIKFALTPES